jgi:hypothetical protein
MTRFADVIAVINQLCHNNVDAVHLFRSERASSLLLPTASTHHTIIIMLHDTRRVVDITASKSLFHSSPLIAQTCIMSLINAGSAWMPGSQS